MLLSLLLIWATITGASTLGLVLLLALDEWQVRSMESRSQEAVPGAATSGRTPSGRETQAA